MLLKAFNFIKSLFYIYWDDHMAFILQFIIVVHHNDWFANIDKSLDPWDKSHLIMVYNPWQDGKPSWFILTGSGSLRPLFQISYVPVPAKVWLRICVLQKQDILMDTPHCVPED